MGKLTFSSRNGHLAKPIELAGSEVFLECRVHLADDSYPFKRTIKKRVDKIRYKCSDSHGSVDFIGEICLVIDHDDVAGESGKPILLDTDRSCGYAEHSIASGAIGVTVESYTLAGDCAHATK